MWAFQGCVYIWSGVVKGPDGTGRDESFDTTEMWVWRGDSWHLVGTPLSTGMGSDQMCPPPSSIHFEVEGLDPTSYNLGHCIYMLDDPYILEVSR